MSQVEFGSVEIIEDSAPVPCAEVLTRTRLERTNLVEMVEAGVVTPNGTTIEQWTFVRRDVKRLEAARRLISDLDINIAGAALILELLDERDDLLKKLREFGAIVEPP